MPKRSFKIDRRIVKRSKLKLVLSILLVIVLLLIGLELTNKTYIFHKRKAISGTIRTSTIDSGSSQAEQSSANNAAGSTKLSDKTGTGPTQAPSNPSSAKLEASPYGTFVSNHHPSLSGKDHPSSEQSVCVTSQGVTCYIEFRNGDVVKSLPKQTTNAEGSTSWSWDVKEAGFTTGTWKITVIAGSNGKQLSTTDQINLEVAP